MDLKHTCWAAAGLTVVVLLELNKLYRRLLGRPLRDRSGQQLVVCVGVVNQILSPADEVPLRHIRNSKLEIRIHSPSIGDQGANAINRSGSVTIEPAHVVEPEHQQHQIRRVLLQNAPDEALVNSRRATPNGKMVTVAQKGRVYILGITPICANLSRLRGSSVERWW